MCWVSGPWGPCPPHGAPATLPTVQDPTTAPLGLSVPATAMPYQGWCLSPHRPALPIHGPYQATTLPMATPGLCSQPGSPCWAWSWPPPTGWHQSLSSWTHWRCLATKTAAALLPSCLSGSAEHQEANGSDLAWETLYYWDFSVMAAFQPGGRYWASSSPHQRVPNAPTPKGYAWWELWGLLSMDPGLKKLWLLVCKEVTKKHDPQGEANCFDLCPLLLFDVRADFEKSTSPVNKCRKATI